MYLTDYTLGFASEKISAGMSLKLYVWPLDIYIIYSLLTYIVLSYNFNHIPRLICLGCPRKIYQTHEFS